MAIQVLGSLFDLFWRGRMGRFSLLKSPERVMQCAGAERERLTNEVGAVWGFLGIWVRAGWRLRRA